LLDAKDFPGAHECYRNAITYYSSVGSQAVQVARCYNNQGYLLAREGRVREAIASYRKAIEELGELDDEVRVLAYINIGELAAKKNTNAAVQAFQKVVDLTGMPDDVLPIESRQKYRMGAAINIALLCALSDWRYALSSLEIGVDLAVRRADSSALKACLPQMISLLDPRQEDDLPAVVTDCLNSALALSEERPVTCSELVRCAAAIAAQDWDNAVNLLKQLREVDPFLTVRIADEILRMDPENCRAHIGKGISLHSLERFEESDEEYRWCIEREPENPIPWNNMAANALRRNDATTAVHYAEKAAALDPEYADPWLAMALAHIVVADTTLARKALRQYLRLASAPEQTLELRALLMSLEASDANLQVAQGRSGMEPER
jgi:tetratricopeptide (TPR) repeat protein